MTATARPPRVDIPGGVWYGGQLAPYLAQLALEYGPIFTFVPEVGPHAGEPVVYLVGPEANRFVLLTQREHFSHDLGWTPVIGESLGHGLLNMDPPEHTRHRALMNPGFTAGFMAGYLPLMQRIVAQRTRDWVTRGTVDLLAEAREITFDVASAALVGFETGSQVDWLRERFYALLHLWETADDDEQTIVERQLKIRGELQGRLLELIDARRRSTDTNAPGDVLGMLVRAHDEHGQALTDEQLLAHVNILLVAGHETTTTLGAWLLYLLATHPRYGERVDAELAATLGDSNSMLTSEALRALPLLANAVREAGRLQSPVLLLPRGVLSAFEFGGYLVSAGTPVFLAIAGGHRLPNIFANPDTLDPDRFLPPREEDRQHPYALATFGGGPRICLGINFAQVEVMALAAHVRRAYTLSSVPGHEVPQQIGGIVQTLPEGIRVHVSPRP